MAGIFPLRGVVKNYEWGGNAFIADLFDIDNAEKLPMAEYWMGIHPQGTSEVLNAGRWEPLSEMISSLPFLLKVLDVKEMLSIQVHPDKKGAEEGFKKENASGIPLTSPQRNYRDSNHKPELMVALRDFWLLHGFKPAEEMTDVLTNVQPFNVFLPLYINGSYSGLYDHIMRMPQAEVNHILGALQKELSTESIQNKNEPDHWAARAFQLYSKDGNFDRGIFSIYLFNLLHLKKGEGIYQGAGLPHAYLEGQNVEIMANSDNVLRGGLTNKNIDVRELLTHVKCEPTWPVIISPEELNKDFVYPTTVTDFQLRRIHLQPGECISLETNTYGILLGIKGEAGINAEGEQNEIHKGCPLLVKGDTSLVLDAKEETVLFLAS